MRIEYFGEILKNRLPEKIETSANQKRGRAGFDTASFRFGGILGFHRRDVLAVFAAHGKRFHRYLKKTANDFDGLPVFCNFVWQADARFSFDD